MFIQVSSTKRINVNRIAKIEIRPATKSKSAFARVWLLSGNRYEEYSAPEYIQPIKEMVEHSANGFAKISTEMYVNLRNVATVDYGGKNSTIEFSNGNRESVVASQLIELGFPDLIVAYDLDNSRGLERGMESRAIEEVKNSKLITHLQQPKEEEPKTETTPETEMPKEEESETETAPETETPKEEEPKTETAPETETPKEETIEEKIERLEPKLKTHSMEFETPKNKKGNKKATEGDVTNHPPFTREKKQ